MMSFAYFPLLLTINLIKWIYPNILRYPSLIQGPTKFNIIIGLYNKNKYV